MGLVLIKKGIIASLLLLSILFFGLLSSLSLGIPIEVKTASAFHGSAHRAELMIAERVINDNVGHARPSLFSLGVIGSSSPQLATPTPPDTINNFHVSCPRTNPSCMYATRIVTLEAGSYSVYQTEGTNYTTAYLGECQGSIINRAYFDQVKKCTIINNDKPIKVRADGDAYVPSLGESTGLLSMLLVTTTVFNDNGGTDVASSFGMRAFGTDVSPNFFAGGQQVKVGLNQGTYSISSCSTPQEYRMVCPPPTPPGTPPFAIPAIPHYSIGQGGRDYMISYSTSCSGTIDKYHIRVCDVYLDDAPQGSAKLIVDWKTTGSLVPNANYRLIIDHPPSPTITVQRPNTATPAPVTLEPGRYTISISCMNTSNFDDCPGTCRGVCSYTGASDVLNPFRFSITGDCRPMSGPMSGTGFNFHTIFFGTIDPGQTNTCSIALS